MTNLIIVRHGYSQANEKNLFLGHGNMDLTEQGRIQAQMTANYLKSIDIDVLYSSDLDRAVQTAEYTAKVKNLPIIKNKNLREIDAGEWDFVSFEDLVATQSDVFSLWATDVCKSYCPGGETFLEVQKRVYSEIEKLCKINDGKTIVVFSHGTSIKAFIGKVLGGNPVETNDLKYPSNSSVTTLIYSDGKFTLTEYSKDDFMGDLTTSLPEEF